VQERRISFQEGVERSLDQSLVTGREKKSVTTIVRDIPVNKIFPNPYQLRVDCELKELIELCESIRGHGGLVHPITVRKLNDSYQIASGYRRLLAYKRMGEKTIPAIVSNLTNEQMLETALIENLQRRNLNPIEEAKGFATLKGTFNMHYRDIGRKVGRTEGYVAQHVRLLSFPNKIQEFLSRDKIGASVAEAIASTPLEIQNKLISIIEEGWTPTVSQVLAFARNEEEKSKTQPENLTTPKPQTPDTQAPITTVRVFAGAQIFETPIYADLTTGPLQTKYNHDYLRSQTEIVDSPVKLTAAIWFYYEHMKVRPTETMTEFLHRVTVSYFEKIHRTHVN